MSHHAIDIGLERERLCLRRALDVDTQASFISDLVEL